jgi:hypothetical protein
VCEFLVITDNSKVKNVCGTYDDLGDDFRLSERFEEEGEGATNYED